MNRLVLLVSLFSAMLFFTVQQANFAHAVDEPLADAKQEQLARDIMLGIRCLVCQNQSIEDSDADLAVDLRQIVREQVSAGKTQEDIHQFLIERYGDWILLSPPFNLQTLLLWLGPFLFLLLALLGVFIFSRKNNNQDDAAEDTAIKTVKATMQGLSVFHVGLLVVSLLGAALFLYVSLGKPNMVADANHSEQLANDEELNDIYDELEAFVENNPDNVEALGRFADLNLTMGRFGDAANAYGNLYSAQPDGGVLPLVLQGEALVRQAQGTVTPAARLTFLNVVNHEPKHPAARYYLGLWFMQNNEPDRALNIWQLLKDDSREDAPWLPMLEFQINGLLGDGGGQPALIPSPSEQAIADVANMSDKDQQVFIDSMVERLRARLDNNPNDYAGWWRLARVEVERGNIEAALVALEQAESYAPAIEKGEISAEYLRLEQQLRD